MSWAAICSQGYFDYSRHDGIRLRVRALVALTASKEKKIECGRIGQK